MTLIILFRLEVKVDNINIELSDFEINLIDSHITKKQDDITNIKNKIHWKWVLADNELEEHNQQQLTRRPPPQNSIMKKIQA